jgi:SulP family sulfate permease
MVAVWRLIDLEEARRAFRISRLDGYALVFTFALTLLLGIEEGILGGTVFSLLAFVRRTTYPDVAELGYVEERDAFLGIRSHPQARSYPGVLIFRFDAPLYYANVPYLEEWLLNATAGKPNLRYVVMDCRGVDTVDATAVEGLEGLVGEYRSSGVEYVFTHAKLPVRERFEKAGWSEKFGDIANYPTTRDPLRAMGLLKDRSTAQSAARYGPKRA